MTLKPTLITVCCFLHTLIIFVWIILGTTIFGTLAIVVSLFSKTGNRVHLVARAWGRSILYVSGIRVDIQGLDVKKLDHSCIFMSNHLSNFDIPVLLGRLPVQFRWLAKAELFRIPIFGRSMQSVGYISIDRSNRASAFESLARAAETIRAGTSVMIFPEGTRSRDGQLRSFKKGGFVMAVDAGVPIVPIAISGTHEIMPKGRLLIRRRGVKVNIRPPIETSDYTRDTKQDLMDRVRASMRDAFLETGQGGRHA